tara:strand:- start:15702 stop:16775 length:1074 start_codon:yes stop_codon:yes gene_type:complete
LYLIEEQESLDHFINDIKDQACIAVDTEFARVSSYYPKLCLVQIATPSLIACIDCLSDIDLSGLWKVIFDKKIEKIMHSCSQDIEIFFLNNHDIPENIFDTQIAAAFIGHSSQVGFKELLEKELNVVIEKSQTRSDWSKRPLAEAQLEYAFDDVEDLIELASSIKGKLVELDRIEWVMEECNDLVHKRIGLMDTSEIWKKTKGINKLKNAPRHLAVLLSKWREEKAAEKDIPRKWLMNDQEIIAIAKCENLSMDALQQFISSNRLNKDEIFELYHCLKNTEEDALSSNQHKKRKKIKDEDLKVVSDYLESRSIELGINKDILGSKKDMAKFIAERGGKLNKGWRKKLMFQDLEDLLN